MAGYISAPNVIYGQLPRTVEISLGLVLLEKERAIVGGANFGHAPRTEDLKYWKDKNLIQPGMERNILICKISKDIKVNSNVIDIALQDLELEQKIIQIYDGKFNRYIVGFNLD